MNPAAAAAATKVERSGPAIRAALRSFAPDEAAVFEAEFQQAVSQASSTFDVAPIEAALDRWWGIAAIRANPLTDEEQAQLVRARGGDFAELHTRDEHGNWVTL